MEFVIHLLELQLVIVAQTGQELIALHVRFCNDLDNSIADSGCPGMPDCSNHGTCNSGSNLCTCENGWGGSACNIGSCEYVG